MNSVLDNARLFAQQLRVEFPTGSERRFAAFHYLLEHLSDFGELEIWPQPVISSSDSAILLSWADDDGHLELEIYEGSVEVFSMLRQGGVEQADGHEFPNESSEYPRILAALRAEGVRVFKEQKPESLLCAIEVRK